MHRALLTLVAAAVLAAALPAAAQADRDARFATFNASLNRGAAGQLVADLSNPAADTVGVRQARNVAEVIQRAAPDVLLINEFDFVAGGTAARLFRDNFLAVSQNGAPAANYPYFYVAPVNTGVPSGFDLDNSGDTNTGDAGNDAWGFGLFPASSGWSSTPSTRSTQAGVRTFQNFLWKDMPGSRIPQPFYSPEEVAAFRLSSKSHWDVPVQVGKRTVHFLVSHPTPPVFDGPEDRNGLRNADEIRFWADYVTPGRGGYIYDDEGGRGGLDASALFVVAGDQNSDPLDGDSLRDAAGNPIAIQPLLNSPRVNSRSTPSSAGAAEASALQGGANTAHLGDPRFDTADFSDSAPGNLRADYVLPSRQVKVSDSAVFWPVRSDPLSG